MKKVKSGKLVAMFFAVTAALGMYSYASAHCDTLDGPVVRDARQALADKEVSGVLKWVPAKDEKNVKAAFSRALAAQGTKQQQAAEQKFFESLVRIHRAGEGASFTELKPAGQVEPIIAAADKALVVGSPDDVIKLVNEAVSHGVQLRYEKVAAALRHKDESVQKGREYVAAYVEYTHYVERLQMNAAGVVAHHGESAHGVQGAGGHQHGQ